MQFLQGFGASTYFFWALYKHVIGGLYSFWIHYIHNIFPCYDMINMLLHDITHWHIPPHYVNISLPETNSGEQCSLWGKCEGEGCSLGKNKRKKFMLEGWSCGSIINLFKKELRRNIPPPPPWQHPKILVKQMAPLPVKNDSSLKWLNCNIMTKVVNCSQRNLLGFSIHLLSTTCQSCLTV